MSKIPRSRTSFLQKYLNGEALSEDIDDYIDTWHESSGKKELFKFLGMTKEEYSLWLRDPDVLPHIARARRAKLPLSSIIQRAIAELPVAARSADEPKVKLLLKWLEREGISVE